MRRMALAQAALGVFALRRAATGGSAPPNTPGSRSAKKAPDFALTDQAGKQH